MAGASLCHTRPCVWPITSLCSHIVYTKAQAKPEDGRPQCRAISSWSLCSTKAPIPVELREKTEHAMQDPASNARWDRLGREFLRPRRRLRPCGSPSSSLLNHEAQQAEKAVQYVSAEACRLLPLGGRRNVDGPPGHAISPKQHALSGGTVLYPRFPFPAHENAASLFVGLRERLSTMLGVFSRVVMYGQDSASRDQQDICPWALRPSHYTSCGFSRTDPHGFSVRENPLCYRASPLHPPTDSLAPDYLLYRG
jgi:hypothetical protein